MKTVSPLPFLVPRLEDMLFVALFLGVLGLGPRLLNTDGDLGRHLTIGGLILETGRIPTRDLFSHTLNGAALTPHEWLAQVLFALAYRLGRLDGVIFFCALLVAITFALVYRQCLARSDSVLVSLGLTVLAAGAASLHWLARPHLFTLLFAVLWSGMLERARRGERLPIWQPPLLMLVWANTHGAFIAGFVIWGLYLAAASLPQGSQDAGPQFDRRVVLPGLLALPASLTNPAGWRLWETSLGFLRNRYLVGHTAEYLPLDFHTLSAWPFLAMIAISILLLGLRTAKPGRAPVIILAAWTAMGLYSARNVPLYAVLAAPALAELARSLPARLRGLEDRLSAVDRQLRGHLAPVWALSLAALALSGGVRLDFAGQGNRFDPAVFPVAAVDWLAERDLPGEMFNYFPWGGFLLYREWPARRVFIDGQTDFYGEALTRQYEQVITLQQGWQAVLQQYGVGWALVPAVSDLAEALRREPGWREAYRDETAVIFSHDG